MKNSPLKHNFTMTGLIVVVAVLAVFVSLLLPSLSNARYNAKISTCLSNLGQQGRAVFLYTNNNNQKYPNLSPRIPSSPGSNTFLNTYAADNVIYNNGHFRRTIGEGKQLMHYAGFGDVVDSSGSKDYLKTVERRQLETAQKTFFCPLAIHQALANDGPHKIKEVSVTIDGESQTLKSFPLGDPNDRSGAFLAGYYYFYSTLNGKPIPKPMRFRSEYFSMGKDEMRDAGYTGTKSQSNVLIADSGAKMEFDDRWSELISNHPPRSGSKRQLYDSDGSGTENKNGYLWFDWRRFGYTSTGASGGYENNFLLDDGSGHTVKNINRSNAVSPTRDVVIPEKFLVD